MLKPVKALYFSSLCLLISLIFALPALAAKVENLYTLSALVADTSDEQRDAATEQLFRQLIVKVSGSETSLNKLPPEEFSTAPEEFEDLPDFELWQTLPAANQFVSQFNYKDTDSYLTLEDGSKVAAQQLSLSFEPTAVRNYLTQLNLPLWGENRPQVIFWVAIESRNGRYLVTPRINQPLSDVLIEQNQRRGLPFVLPNLGRDNKTQTIISEIWGGFNQEVLQASTEYQADAIALGKIKDTGTSSWQVEWQLIHNNRSYEQRLNASNLRQALEAGSNFVAENLASLYASSPSLVKQSYLIKVAGVEAAKDVAALQRYLAGLSLTKSVVLVEAEKQQLVFKLVLQGSLEQFKANLRLDKRLQEDVLGISSVGDLAASSQIISPAVNEDAAKIDAYYRWN